MRKNCIVWKLEFCQGPSSNILLKKLNGDLKFKGFVTILKLKYVHFLNNKKM